MVFSALTVAGSDSGGGAGVQADLKTFAAHRVHGVCVLTSLTAQNTVEVSGVSHVPRDFIEGQFEAVHRDFDVRAAKTGMLGTSEIIESVAKKIGEYPLVVDPVMVSESGVRLLSEDAVETLKSVLLPKAMVVTPNVFEAEIISGMKISSAIDVKNACTKITEFGCDVVIKGGHLDGVDVMLSKGRFQSFSAPLLEGGFHGSGCSFAAAVTSNLAVGFDLASSVSNAKAFITGALETAYAPGRGGVSVVNQMRVSFEESFDVIQLAVRKAVWQLEALDRLSVLTPEVGMNLCYARAGAESPVDVAGLSGRLLRVGDKVRAVGTVKYGGSRHMARVVLAAMDCDSTVRAAVNIKYRPETIDAVEKAGEFSVSSFNREDEPGQSSTMEWGTREAIRVHGSVPDIVYDQGGVGKEPMIRVLGANPSEVLFKLKKIIDWV